MKIYLIKKDVDYWFSCVIGDQKAAYYMESEFDMTRVSYFEYLLAWIKYKFRQFEKQFGVK